MGPPLLLGLARRATDRLLEIGPEVGANNERLDAQLGQGGSWKGYVLQRATSSLMISRISPAPYF